MSESPSLAKPRRRHLRRHLIPHVWMALHALSASAAPQTTDADASAGAKPAAIGTPIAAYDSTLLLGLGGFGQVVWPDPTGATPFRASAAAQIYFTTGGYRDHYLRWDLPNAFGSRLRWDARVRRLRWSQAPYFGIGAAPPRRPDASIQPKYYVWNSDRMFIRSNLRRPISNTGWDVYGTVILAAQSVDPYADSLLSTERPEGIEGGTLVVTGVGLFHDNRSNEIDPRTGTVWDLQVRNSSTYLGSASDWTGLHASWRAWRSPHPDVTLATRALLDGTFGDTPFHQQTYLGGLRRSAIGGRFFLRGLTEERIRADGVAGLQLETRWRFWGTTLGRSLDLEFQTVPFIDVGQPWVYEPTPETAVWTTFGAGLRVNIKQVMILRADVGVAWERYDRAPLRRPQVLGYVLADHPF